MRENEPTQQQEPRLDALMSGYLECYASGDASASAEAAEKIQQWMERYPARQEFVRNRLEELGNEPEENERRSEAISSFATDNKAAAELKKILFQEHK